jgi:hypothetical protein
VGTNKLIFDISKKEEKEQERKNSEGRINILTYLF